MFEPAEQDTGVSGGPANNEEYGEQAQVPLAQAGASQPVSPKASADAFRALSARLNAGRQAVQAPLPAQPDATIADIPKDVIGPDSFAPQDEAPAEMYAPQAVGETVPDTAYAALPHEETADHVINGHQDEVIGEVLAPVDTGVHPVPFEGDHSIEDTQAPEHVDELVQPEQPQPEQWTENSQPVADMSLEQAAEATTEFTEVEAGAAEIVVGDPDPCAEHVAVQPGLAAQDGVAQPQVSSDCAAEIAAVQFADNVPCEEPVSAQEPTEQLQEEAAVVGPHLADAADGTGYVDDPIAADAEPVDAVSNLQSPADDDDFEVNFAVPDSMPDAEVDSVTIEPAVVSDVVPGSEIADAEFTGPEPDQAALAEEPHCLDQIDQPADAPIINADPTSEIKEILRHAGTNGGSAESEPSSQQQPFSQAPVPEQDEALQEDAGDQCAHEAIGGQPVSVETDEVVDYTEGTVIEIDFDEDDLDAQCGEPAPREQGENLDIEAPEPAGPMADAPLSEDANAPVEIVQADDLDSADDAVDDIVSHERALDDSTDCPEDVQPQAEELDVSTDNEPQPEADENPELDEQAPQTAAVEEPVPETAADEGESLDTGPQPEDVAGPPVPDAAPEDAEPVAAIADEIALVTQDDGDIDDAAAADIDGHAASPDDATVEDEAAASEDLAAQDEAPAQDEATAPVEAPAQDEVAASDEAPAQDDESGQLDDPEPTAGIPDTTGEHGTEQEPGELTDIMSSIVEKFSTEPSDSGPAETKNQTADPDNAFRDTAEVGIDPDFDEAKTDPEAGEAARMLLDIMSKPSGASQPQERALAADTLLRLVTKIPVVNLVGLSERICMMEQPPVLLVNKLIRHPDTRVAGPILETCNAISDQVLMPLIAKTDDEKRRMIARRLNLSSALCDALLEHGDASVLLTIVRNPGASLSHDAFSILSEHAKVQPSLQAPLVTRGDTPAPTAFELFWFLPSELRRYVLSRFLTDSETLDKILKIALAVDTSVSIDDQADAKFPERAVVAEVVNLIEDGSANDAAEKLAAAAGINQANALRIISDPDGEPLSVAMKAMGLSRNQFFDAMQRWQSSSNCLIKTDRPTVELQNLFDSLSFNKARVLLTYWDWAALESGPYARKAA